MITPNLYDTARIMLTEVLSQKWNRATAVYELENAVFKIHSIVMGTSDTFHFTAILPSGRVHSIRIKYPNKIEHKIID